MEKRRPDYGFKEGLQITARDVRSGQSWLVALSLGELRATAMPSEQLIGEVAEHMRNPVLVRGVGGVGLELAAIGPSDAEKVIFFCYGWGGNVRHPVAVYEAGVLAANNPGAQLVFVNTFGTGRSGLPPKAVSGKIKQRGTYGPAGEYVASVFDKVVEGREVHLRGHSLGARMAAGTAPYLKNRAETMILNDPTGTRRMGLLGIVRAFALAEGKHLRRYAEARFDPVVSQLQQHPVRSSVWDTAEGTKGGWKQQFLVDPSGLRLNAFEGDLRQAIPHVKSLVRIISPEMSALNNPQVVADILGRCCDIGTAKLQQYVLRDHTHSVVTIPQVLARLYEEKLGTN